MIYRTFDLDLVSFGLSSYEEIVGLDSEVWLANPDNIALANEYGDVGMFERQYRSPTTVAGHYFFVSRGKRAREEAKKFLKEVFTGPYNVHSIVGLTPVEHKAAAWMTRQLGFTFYDEINTEVGPCTFALLTKEEWLRLEGNN